MRRFFWTAFFGVSFGVLWAVLYRINDNAMFAEWDSTYRYHIELSRKEHEAREAKRKEEGIEYDTKPFYDESPLLLQKK